MASDIYVQITAAQKATGRSRTVVVLVTASALESTEGEGSSNPIRQKAVAKKLAEPFARYAFTHRTIFDDYEVSYAFYESRPAELGDKSPLWTQDGLQAWLVG